VSPSWYDWRRSVSWRRSEAWTSAQEASSTVSTPDGGSPDGHAPPPVPQAHEHTDDELSVWELNAV
jgi:hypothetical protein